MAKKKETAKAVVAEKPKQVCPVCGQSISPYNDEKGLLVIDQKKMRRAIQNAARKYGGDMTQGMRGQ